MRCASYLAAAILFLAVPSIASAQDVMQLDTMFRDSLLKPEPQPHGERRRLQHGQVPVVRHHPKRRHRKV